MSKKRPQRANLAVSSVPKKSPKARGIRGDRVRAARESLGWTQFELARQSNIQVSAISLVEAGRKDLNASSVVALCRTLNVSADYLLGLSEESARK